MLKTLFWMGWMMIYLLRKVPAYLRVKRLEKQGRTEERQALIDREVERWTRALLRHIKLNLIVEGRENLPQNGETVVFVSNHQSYLDIPILLSSLDKPHALMAKKELFKVPLLGRWMEELGCICVDRADARSGIGVLREAEEWLESGQSLIVCPEGTRTKADRMGTFKQGSVRIAKRVGAPIIPVAIDGSFLALEGNGNRLQPADVRLVVLPRIETAGLDRDGTKALNQELFEKIQAAKDNRPPGLLPPRGGEQPALESGAAGE